MNVSNEVEKQLEVYQKERVVMNIKDFDKLLKRVNIEDNDHVKSKMLNIIERYLGALTTGDVVVNDVAEIKAKPQQAEVEAVEEIVIPVDNIASVEEEDIQVTAAAEIEVEPVVITEEMAVEAVEENVEECEMNQQNAAIEYAEQQEAEVIVDETVEPVVEAVEAAVKETPVVEETPVQVVEEAVIEEVIPEELAVEEVAETPVREEESVSSFVETFNLVATTNDEHMEQVKTKGGILFREKLTTMLGLCLEDELLALAKTSKIEELPKEIRDHLKDGGFCTVDVANFGEIVKKSRTRSVETTLRNIVALPEDHWIAKNVKDLLYSNKLEEEDEEEVQTPAVEEVKEETKPEANGIISAEATMLINPNFVGNFQDKKEQVLQQQFALSSDGSAARLLANGGGKAIVVAAENNTEFASGTYQVRIMDYTMTTEGGQTAAHFSLKMLAKEEQVEQPAPTSQPKAPKQEKVSMPVEAIGEIPSDFPSSNQLTLDLHKCAEAQFSLETARKAIGKPISLVFTTEEGVNRIGLVSGVFEMATGNNTLTKEAMRDSKWFARLSNVDITEKDSVKTIHIEVDALRETELFAGETKETAPSAYLPITEERYQAFQEARQVAQTKANEEVKKQEEAPAPQTKSVEELLAPKHSAKLMEQIQNPHPNTDYAKAKEQLLGSQPGDIGKAVDNLRKSQAVTAEDRENLLDKADNILKGVISQTLTESGIHTTTETKEKPVGATQVVGNLQEGAGNYSETETAITFKTTFPEKIWHASIGREIRLVSQMAMGNGPIVGKTVNMLGKDNQVVAQGHVDFNVALLADGNQHEAQVLSVEKVEQFENGYNVTLKLGNFKKLAIA